MKRAIVALLLVVFGLSACHKDRPAEVVPIPDIERIAIIVMENKEVDDVIGNEDAPFFNDLATSYSQTTEMFALTHPSLPNYIALISGDTYGVDSDCYIEECPLEGPTLVNQLDAAGISWKAYMQGMTERCMLEDTDQYAVRHDPFVYFRGVRKNRSLCSNVVPMTELSHDLDGDPPRFMWITPGLCNSTHDCNVSEGDAFLADIVPPLLKALGPKGLLIVTYDEGTSDLGCCGIAKGGQIPTVIAGPMAKRGAESPIRYTTYSLLRTIEEGFDLDLLGHAGDPSTKPITDLIGST